MKLEDMIEVMQAFKDGKKIESKIVFGTVWYEENSPTWNWDKYDYRIKSKEKESEEMMTHLQLAELLAKGYGMYRYEFLPSFKAKDSLIYITHNYELENENNPIDKDIVFRTFGSPDWKKATKALYDSLSVRSIENR